MCFCEWPIVRCTLHLVFLPLTGCCLCTQFGIAIALRTTQVVRTNGKQLSCLRNAYMRVHDTNPPPHVCFHVRRSNAFCPKTVIKVTGTWFTYSGGDSLIAWIYRVYPHRLPFICLVLIILPWIRQHSYFSFLRRTGWKIHLFDSQDSDDEVRRGDHPLAFLDTFHLLVTDYDQKTAQLLALTVWLLLLLLLLLPLFTGAFSQLPVFVCGPVWLKQSSE